MAGVSFAGKGGSDISEGANSTNPPRATGGSKDGGVEFAGSGMSDVRVSTDDASQHCPSKHNIEHSKGPDVQFAGNV